MDKINDSLFTGEIAAYCRISVDDELDKDNTSIENQKNIISDYAKKNFPNANITFYIDRDRSGYTFEQREAYQKMRKRLISGEISILLLKDFSRFSRRNSRGLCELEDLKDYGVRIISIGDAIDFPSSDEWLSIQFRFLINELPVTDTSKKIRAIVKRRQEDGKWSCALPYGYVFTNIKKHEFEIVPDEAEVIREIFDLYVNGWGYKKIANYLTNKNIPTPRTKERMRIEERGDEYNRKNLNPAWSIVTVQGIISNDFYIGTLRQHKYSRKNINGKDISIPPEENYVFENHHEPIINIRTWSIAQNLLKQRSTSHYRGQKKNDNFYSGLIYCGDCESSMFASNRTNAAPAYICSKYHKEGRQGCTSHFVRVDFLDCIIKEYIRKIRDNSNDILHALEQSLKNESTEVYENENTITLLEQHLKKAKDELKAIERRKVKEITKLEIQLENNPGLLKKIQLMEETYQELEDEVTLRISGLENQINLTTNKRNDIIRVNRLARTVIDIFNAILEKPKLDRTDIQLIVEKITIFNDRIDIQLKADVDQLLKRTTTNNSIDTINFNQGNKVIIDKDTFPCTLQITAGNDNTSVMFALHPRNHAKQLFVTNVVSSGSPSRIRRVLLISFGTTTRPKSSIRRTIPVAFIYKFLL